jgi:hypothetical protein
VQLLGAPLARCFFPAHGQILNTSGAGFAARTGGCLRAECAAAQSHSAGFPRGEERNFLADTLTFAGWTGQAVNGISAAHQLFERFAAMITKKFKDGHLNTLPNNFSSTVALPAISLGLVSQKCS